MRADVATVLVKGALLAPLAALEENRGSYTAHLKDGRKVPVKVGQTSLTHAEILAGLSEGDELRLR